MSVLGTSEGLLFNNMEKKNMQMCYTHSISLESLPLFTFSHTVDFVPTYTVWITHISAIPTHQSFPDVLDSLSTNHLHTFIHSLMRTYCHWTLLLHVMTHTDMFAITQPWSL
jgi:hypothetical protein